jgi:hypothetical protein
LMFSCHQNFMSYLNFRFVTLIAHMGWMAPAFNSYQMRVSFSALDWNPLASSLKDTMGSFPGGKVAWCYCLEKLLSYHSICMSQFNKLSEFEKVVKWNNGNEMIWIFHVDVIFIVDIHFTTCLFTFADLLFLFRRF